MQFKKPQPTILFTTLKLLLYLPFKIIFKVSNVLSGDDVEILIYTPDRLIKLDITEMQN